MQTSKLNKTFFPGRKYHLGSDYSRKRSDLLKEKIRLMSARRRICSLYQQWPYFGNFICDESERPSASEGENGDSKVLLGLWLRVLFMRETQTSKEEFSSEGCLLVIYWLWDCVSWEFSSPVGEPNNDRANLDSTRIYLEELESLYWGLLPEQWVRVYG